MMFANTGKFDMFTTTDLEGSAPVISRWFDRKFDFGNGKALVRRRCELWRKGILLRRWFQHSLTDALHVKPIPSMGLLAVTNYHLPLVQNKWPLSS